jgi:hypothetical protein
VLSASDLVNFLGRSHASQLDLRDLTDPKEVPARYDVTVLVFDKGVEHERRYLATLKARGFNVIEVPGDGFDLYPDFMLRQIKGGKQHLSFIEPHDLQHEGPGHKKIEFHAVIKDIQLRLSAENAVLNSLIVIPTRFAKLHWGKSIDELQSLNLLFVEDQMDTYVGTIIEKMLT